MCAVRLQRFRAGEEDHAHHVSTIVAYIYRTVTTGTSQQLFDLMPMWHCLLADGGTGGGQKNSKRSWSSAKTNKKVLKSKNKIETNTVDKSDEQIHIYVYSFIK